MKITKLNEDSSWLWECNGLKILVDPWFTDDQVDFHPLFSKQTHLDVQPKVHELEKADFIFISHPFTDHCNQETLLQLDANIPVVCIEPIAKKIKRWQHFQFIIPIEQAPFSIELISQTSFLDLVHHAYRISDSCSSMIYAPHGTRRLKRTPKTDVLLTTLSTYKLPFFLGGNVNLGLKSAVEKAQELQAKTIISTHDEQKLQAGFVRLVSKRSFVQTDQFLTLSKNESYQF
ncbi:MAG: MBL fold metallo-hydrolase [Flavobacteriales bacterium]